MFDCSQISLIEDALSRSQAAVETLLAQGWDKAAQQLHTEPKPARPAKKEGPSNP